MSCTSASLSGPYAATRNSSASERLGAVVRSAMAKEPGARYPSAGGLLEYVAKGFGNGHVVGITAWLIDRWWARGLLLSIAAGVTIFLERRSRPAPPSEER